MWVLWGSGRKYNGAKYKQLHKAAPGMCSSIRPQTGLLTASARLVIMITAALAS